MKFTAIAQVQVLHIPILTFSYMPVGHLLLNIVISFAHLNLAHVLWR